MPTLIIVCPLAAVHLLSSFVLTCQSYVKPILYDETAYVRHSLVVVIYAYSFISSLQKTDVQSRNMKRFVHMMYYILLIIH